MRLHFRRPLVWAWPQVIDKYAGWFRNYMLQTIDGLDPILRFRPQTGDAPDHYREDVECDPDTYFKLEDDAASDFHLR